MDKKSINYNIGLDIGTNSVGWSVTDEDNSIVKLNSKRHMWGVRLFEEASPAAERRTFRSNRRRMERKKERIRLLQAIFKDEVNSDFFEALALSKYHLEDEMVKKSKRTKRNNKYNLFNDTAFNDKDLYKKYATVYHLRNDLMFSDKKIDVRLVYLGIHHILKYRGNFLFAGDFSEVNNEEIKDKISEVINYILEKEVNINSNKIYEILADKNIQKRNKVDEILEILKENSEFPLKLDSNETKKIKSLFRLVINYKEDLNKIFNIEDKKSVRFTDDYDEAEIESILGDDIECFKIIKDLNSWYLLKEILKDNTYISEAFKQKYEKYGKDLKLLKDVYKLLGHDTYKKMFSKGTEKNSYYIFNKGKKECDLENLYKKIKADLKCISDNEKVKQILLDIDNEEFLINLNTTDNGAIPYQLQKKELEYILDNQGKHYSFLKENKDKILKILSFKIPYYVGPLHSEESQANNWSIRKPGMENTKVYPWNFDEVIDKEASANEFIRRMTNKCTYLPEEDVIPKNSLLYAEYCLLNELNKISYDGKRLSVADKQKCIEVLFKHKKTVKEKDIKKVLEDILNKKISKVEGFQKEGEFASSLAAYIDFTKILGEVNDSNIEVIEQIIEYITLFEDKDILKSSIEKLDYKLTEEQIGRILKLNYSGWSRLSKKLLVGLKTEDAYQQKFSILDILRKTNENFMQIIESNEYSFKKQIEEHAKPIDYKEIDFRFYEENIQTLAGSPAIKRGIWQSIKVVDEITKIMGHEPTNIFVEFAREDGEKGKRTDTRRKKLKVAYDKFLEDNKDELNKEITKRLSNEKLDITERLYLYISQNGRCMYSDEALEIDLLETYQIDHIVPQSKIKDDSIDNIVLVKSERNQRKLNGYISDTIKNNMESLWGKLYKSGLISQIKYYSLLNNEETDKRIEGFMKRQLVETRQITKHVTNILTNLYDETKVYAIKSKLGSDFRSKYKIVKIRELNDMHHAHDAYINSVVGMYITKMYPKLLREFEYKEYIQKFKDETKESEENKDTKKDKNKDNKNKFGFIVSKIGKEYVDVTTGECISEEQSQKDIENVLKQLDIRDMYITRKLEEQTAAFYNQTMITKEEAQKSNNLNIQIKEDLEPAKYGGYTGEIMAYSVLFSYIKKDKLEFQIKGIPVKQREILTTNEKIKEYIENRYGFKNVTIIVPKILKNQLIYKEKTPYLIVNDNEYKIYKPLILNKGIQSVIYIALSGEKIKKKAFINIAETYLVKQGILENCNSELSTEAFKDICLDYAYDVLTEKIKTEYFEKVGEKLENAKETYSEIALEEKIGIIKRILSLTKGPCIDLSKIMPKGSGQGRIKGKNMNTEWLQNTIFVSQSVTGMYERRYSISELQDNSSNK